MGNRLTKQESPIKEEKVKTPAREQKPEPNKEQKKSTFQRILARFQIRSKKSESPTPKSQNGETKTLSPPPKPPLRNHSERIQSKHSDSNESLKKSRWTDIPLEVPETPGKPKNEIEIKITPKPPPRKHKIKLHELLQSTDEVDKTISFDQNSSLTSDQRVPVEEPIIIPKKVIEHVCDGTHHHVKNIVNGKVIDQIIFTNKEIKQNKSAPKHASTLSLPSYVELKKKEDKRAPSPTKSSKKKSSASSLPTDKKVKPSHTAAEKLESYMIRCKSFGSIIPHTKNEKVKTAENNSDKESIDSWCGLEDWDLGIIEHDVSTDMPRGPSKNKSKNSINESNKNIRLSQLDSPKQEEELINSIKPDTKEFDDLLAAMDQSYNTNQQSPPYNLPITKTPDSSNKSLNTKSYPFKPTGPKNVFENDVFFTSEFIMNERKSHHDNAFHNKIAPLAAFDSDKESEKDSAIHSTDEVDDKARVIKKEPNNQSAPQSKPEISKSTNKTAPTLIPRRKSSSGHSKLLKYIKDEHKHVQKPLSGNIVQEQKQHIEKIEFADKIEEPEIVPLIRKIDGLWDKLAVRPDINNTPLLEQESTISDLVETSSDDTRSTTKSTIEVTNQ